MPTRLWISSWSMCRRGNRNMLKAWLDGGCGVDLESGASFILKAGETLLIDLASGGHWFGHGFSHVQPYPLESGTIVNKTFAVNNIQSPVWMCSAGYALLADTKDPLDVRINENGNGRLSLASVTGAAVPVRVFRGGSLPEGRAALMKSLGWPNKPPAAAMFGDSLFCTWTQFPRCLSQERVVGMARQIRARGYPCSTLIIDDRWESCFGELSFSRDFPDPKGMIDELRTAGFGVWLWVTPFVNQESAVYGELAAKGVLVRSSDGSGAAPMKWWGGTAGLVDLTGRAGREWMKERLMRLKNDFGVEGFKIDGGDFKYQPAPEISAWQRFLGASGYSDALLSLFEEVSPNACETRTAWLSQGRSILWREGGKDSHWGQDNGLKAMVALGIHLGLMGYDILIPDMIPGRVQTMVSEMALPSDELMVRWTEASAFFPIMQFSYVPWNYAGATEEAVRGFALLHKALEGYIVAQAANRAAPLLRPIWYDAPGREELYGATDEFMLGGDILVAPVLDPGIVTRDIILPPGDWIDAWTGAGFAEGRITGHPAPCPGMPVFVRGNRKDLAALMKNCLRDIKRGSVESGITTTKYSAGLDRDLSVTG
ncbi:MAG: hypothetical protein C0404_09885 [Verrucomicrobia bacterium]|nr:hypothetical protein [Verrucomicrobiota bacterium]